jgi:hypothetical protein
MRSQNRASAGEMVWPNCCGVSLTNVSVLQDGQLIVSSELSNPQFAHFFIIV